MEYCYVFNLPETAVLKLETFITPFNQLRRYEKMFSQYFQNSITQSHALSNH